MKLNCFYLSDCISKEPVLVKDSGFFLAEDMLFISVLGWEGWGMIQSEQKESRDHHARWEFLFYPEEERGWVFLRITWPSISEIVLGFIYPDDRRILEEIALHRRLVLTDQALTEGQPYPFYKGLVVDDIPVDLLKVFGIDFDGGQNLIQ